MYRVDVYVDKKDKARRVKTVASNIQTEKDAERICNQKNRDLGINPDTLDHAPGQRYAMIDYA